MSDVPIYINQEDQDLYNDLLNQYLRDNLSQNGFSTPIKTTSEITDIASSVQNGTLWYDSDTDELKVKSAGVVKVVQVI